MELKMDYEDVKGFSLDPEVQEAMLREQNECTFIWTTKDGAPVGILMTYVWQDGKIWTLTAKQRPRFKAVCRDPRVCVVVSSAGTRFSGDATTWGVGAGTAGLGQKMVMIRGRCTTHEDADTKRWFYPALAKVLLQGGSEAQIQGFIKTIDTPGRAVLCVTPERLVTWDSDKLAIASAGGLGMSNA